jgi:hypothetical protein
MKMKVYFLLLSSLCLLSIQAQVFSFESKEDSNTITHRVFMDDTYFVETLYRSDPPNFISTRGGFYTIKGNTIQVNFEFNSNFEKDRLKQMDFKKTKDWKKISFPPKDLNGKWLMAGRMTPEGERRRDTSGPRKTMKFLLEGFFQWIAFNTETFQFFGSGGGYYTAADGKYTEHIEYFSRDNTRVGAALPFDYELKGTDWHHQGLSSKGAPLYEIWSLRN